MLLNLKTHTTYHRYYTYLKCLFLKHGTHSLLSAAPKQQAEPDVPDPGAPYSPSEMHDRFTETTQPKARQRIRADPREPTTHPRRRAAAAAASRYRRRTEGRRRRRGLGTVPVVGV
jgi:hypothetical protein